MDIETQCEAIQCSILVKITKKKNQSKHGLISCCGNLDQYRKSKQDVSNFKTQIGNMDRAPILWTRRTFLSSGSSLTGNEIPAPKPLAEITTNYIF